MLRRIVINEEKSGESSGYVGLIHTTEAGKKNIS